MSANHEALNGKYTIFEPAREIPLCREVDVLVVGGGPGGIGSAIAAARCGAKTALIERYGYLGGMGTGGLVNIIPNMSDIYGKQHIFGITQEIVDRLDRRGGAAYPKKENWGTTDKKVVDYYLDANFGWFYIRQHSQSGQKHVLYTAVVDPEVFKDELNIMVTEAGIDLFLHSWAASPLMEGNTVKGVAFESKSGRQAISAKVVIDSTGDGDIFVRAGAPFDGKLDVGLRTSKLAIVFWLANVNLNKADEFRKNNPEKHGELMKELMALDGHPFYFKGILPHQEGCAWFHFFQTHPDRAACDPMNVEELTMMDMRARHRALVTYEFFRKYVPGFEKSYIIQTAPQLGIQGGRRILGEYTLAEKDLESDEIFEDTIVALANNDFGPISAKHPTLCVPYRCLVPKDIDGLLVACRGFSSSDGINHCFNIIPHCLSYGQAAGTAAAMAVDKDIPPRMISYKDLQDHLATQGVWIPTPRINPSVD
jgi:hypothetical protein